MAAPKTKLNVRGSEEYLARRQEREARLARGGGLRGALREMFVPHKTRIKLPSPPEKSEIVEGYVKVGSERRRRRRMKVKGTGRTTREAGDALAKARDNKLDPTEPWSDKKEGKKPWEHGYTPPPKPKRPRRRAPAREAGPRRTTEEEHIEAIQEPKRKIVEEFGEKKRK